MLAYWSSTGTGLSPTWGGNLSKHAAFHYHPSIALVLLKYCWRRGKILSHPSIHFRSSGWQYVALVGRPICSKKEEHQQLTKFPVHRLCTVIQSQISFGFVLQCTVYVCTDWLPLWTILCSCFTCFSGNTIIISEVCFCLEGQCMSWSKNTGSLN